MQEFESKKAKSEQTDARRAYVAPELITLGDAKTEQNTGAGADGGGGTLNRS